MNILFAILLVGAVLFVFMLSLRFLTRHGSTLTIPAVTGKSYTDAKSLLEQRGFEVEIQDSIYNDTAAPLSVLRQFPDADEMVKVNRTVYLTINRSIPPTIEMPLLEGLSFRNAEMVMRQYGLKLEDTTYKPDFAKNSVLEQLRGGVRIKPGTKITMGSSITLVLGSGLGQDEFPVPDLFGLSYSEAKMVLQSNSLIPGVIVTNDDVRDTLNAYIFRQSPERFSIDRRFNRIRQGQSVDVWLSVQRPIRAIDSSAKEEKNQN